MKISNPLFRNSLFQNSLFQNPLLVGVVFASTGAFVHADTMAWDAEIEAGLEYDSNLNVVELDTVSEDSDTAWLFTAGLDGTFTPTDRLTMTGGYSFSSTNYLTHSDFDQDIHLASADVSYDFDAVTVGTSYHYSRAFLASEPLLDFSLASVYLGKLFDNGVYLRGSLQEKRKTFEDEKARNAEAQGVSADVYYFFNDAQTMISIGVDRDDEDASSEVFDNEMLGFRSRFSHRFLVSGHNHKVQLGWRYVERDYADQDPLLGNPRHDAQGVVDASWAVGLNSVFTVEGKVESGRYRSTLETADYDETLVSAILRASF